MENTTQNSAPQSGNDSGKMVMGILAYLGILVVIPFIFAKDNPFVKFHIKQGLVLLAIEAVVWVLGMVFWPVIFISWLVNLALFVLSIIGIINVAQGQQKNLPFVGDFAKYFTF